MKIDNELVLPIKKEDCPIITFAIQQEIPAYIVSLNELTKDWPILLKTYAALNLLGAKRVYRSVNSDGEVIVGKTGTDIYDFTPGLYRMVGYMYKRMFIDREFLNEISKEIDWNISDKNDVSEINLRDFI